MASRAALPAGAGKVLVQCMEPQGPAGQRPGGDTFVALGNREEASKAEVYITKERMELAAIPMLRQEVSLSLQALAM